MGNRGLPMVVTVVLTLVVSTVDVKATGEFCHGWQGANGSWRGGFQCPERFDSQEAIICCGKCELRYCCSRNDARLDQGTCDDNKQGHERGADTNENKGKEAAPVYMPFLMVGTAFVAFVLGGSAAAACCCRWFRPGQQASPGGTGDREGAGGRSLETVPMTTSTSSSSALSWLHPPSPDGGLTAVYLNMSASPGPQGQPPQYLAYTLPHHQTLPSSAHPFIQVSPGGFPPSQSPCPPPASSCTSIDHRYTMLTV